MELKSCPLCVEVDVLSIIVDDESCDSVQSGVVAGNVDSWAMTKT